MASTAQPGPDREVFDPFQIPGLARPSDGGDGEVIKPRQRPLPPVAMPGLQSNKWFAAQSSQPKPRWEEQDMEADDNGNQEESVRRPARRVNVESNDVTAEPGQATKEVHENDKVEIEAIPSTPIPSALTPKRTTSTITSTKLVAEPRTSTPIKRTALRRPSQDTSSVAPHTLEDLPHSLQNSKQWSETDSVRSLRTIDNDDEDNESIFNEPRVGGSIWYSKFYSGDNRAVPTVLLPTPKDVGQRVKVADLGFGTLRYFGPRRGLRRPKPQIWLGIELDNPRGLHNGTWKGQIYFDCADSHGIMLPLSHGRVQLLQRATAWVNENDDELSEPTREQKPKPKPILVAQAESSTGGDIEEAAGPFASMLPSLPDMFRDVFGSRPAQGPSAINELHELANVGDLDELKEAIKRGIHPINSQDPEGRTPLMHAVHNRHKNCAQLLLKNGANVNISAKDGSTALHEAVSQPVSGIRTDLLFGKAFQNSASAIQILLQSGAELNARDEDGVYSHFLYVAH